jgi:hypothetical protein
VDVPLELDPAHGGPEHLATIVAGGTRPRPGRPGDTPGAHGLALRLALVRTAPRASWESP